MLRNAIILLLFSSIIIVFPSVISAQESKEKNNKNLVVLNGKDSLQSDSTKIIEDAPLDIDQNRGIFIATPDQKMQLRILGSVRYLVVFDNTNLQNKNSFNTFEIPIPSAGQKIPNYYNGLNQTRLGFEITRRTERGNVFVRLETDFAGPDNFRIRHAYGQTGRFLMGQTWSLFSHINALPSMVDFSGPTGSVVARTPQIRYTLPRPIKKINLAAGLEYFPPDLKIPDSLGVETFQLIPNATIRADRSFDWGTAQLSGILPILSGSSESKNETIFLAGWGLSASVVVNSWYQGKWYFQWAGGKAISRYFTDLSGYGFDIAFPPSGGYSKPFSNGFYTTYEHSWSDKVYSNLTYSLVSLASKAFTSENIYHKGHSFRFNTFWDIIEGAKVGGEIITGKRTNYDSKKNHAARINFLFYYDF